MEAKKLFAVVGIDARQAAAGRVLERAGYAVGGAEQVALADYILLPLPLDAARTPLAELLRAAKPGAVALGGRLSVQAKTIAQEAGVELVDYFAREELILCNAIPTAEGCIGILMAERTRTLWNSAILLAGFGPVGQALGVRLAALGAQILTNLCTALVAQKNYPDYVPKGQVEEQTRQKIRGKIKDLFTSRVGVVIVNSADTLVISAFLGLTVLAVYQNYYYIVTSVIGLVGVLFTSTLAGIGNSLLTESRGKNYADFCKFTLLIAWIAGLCTCCLLCLLQPFMKLWIGEAGILPGQIVICLCVYYFIYEFNQLFNAYKDAAGIWHRDRFRTLTTAGVNLVLNLLLVKPMGLYGVILSTVVATVIVGMPWLIHNLFTTLFDGEDRQSYLGTLVFYGSVTFLNCMLTDRVCSQIPVEGIRELLERALVCLLVSNGIFLLCYGGRKDFRALLAMGKRFLPEIPHDKATSGNDRSAEETTKFADYGKAGAFYEDCSSGNRVCGIVHGSSAGPES